MLIHGSAMWSSSDPAYLNAGFPAWWPGRAEDMMDVRNGCRKTVSSQCTQCYTAECGWSRFFVAQAASAVNGFFCGQGARNKESDLSFAEVQNRYATLIEDLGQSRLPSGKSISETFTVDDIPFWEIFSAELAWRHLTTAVAATTPLANAKLLVKPFALRWKERVQGAILLHQDASGCASWPDGPTFLALGLTSRMYRDVLEPVMEYLTSNDACRAVVLTDKPYPGSDQARGKGISHQTLWQHWDSEVRQQTQQLRESMRRVESEFAGARALRHSISTADPHMSAALDKVFLSVTQMLSAIDTASGRDSETHSDQAPPIIASFPGYIRRQNENLYASQQEDEYPLHGYSVWTGR